MTWRDKLELGLKEDAAYRRDNLPPDQVRGPEIAIGPGRSPEVPLSRGDGKKRADADLTHQEDQRPDGGTEKPSGRVPQPQGGWHD